MATTLTLRDHLGRDLQNATPGTTDPALDYLGREVQASDLDHIGRDLIATARANTTAYSTGDYYEFSTGTLYKVTSGGTSDGSEPTDVAYGAAVTDGTVTGERIF